MNNHSGSADGTQLPLSWPITDEEIREVFTRLQADGSWGRYHGPHCDALREELAETFGVAHVTLCSSGTAAVELALRAVGTEAGDEVILAAYDYKANFANVLALGGVPVLIDTIPGAPVPDLSQLADAITDRTAAVICSHLHGSLAPVPEIRSLAAHAGISVVEDACQAHGAVFEGCVAGTVGDVGVLSFGGSKLMTAGRGGAVLTNDRLLAQRIRLYTQRGNDAYPLSEMQAAVLLPQLRQLADRNRQRLDAVRRIVTSLSESSPVVAAVVPDPVTTTDLPSFYKLALSYRPSIHTLTRDEFSAAAREAGVALDPGFPALHQIHSRRRFRAVGELQNATSLHTELLTLHHPVLLSDAEQIDRVIEFLSRVT